MSEVNEIFDRFRRVMRQVFLNVEIILANERGPTPEGNFCTLLPVSIAPGGWGEVTYKDNESGNLDETIQTRAKYMISVNFFKDDKFGNSPKQQARRLGAFMRSGLGTRSLSDEAFGFISATTPLDLSALESAQFEGRSQTDIIITTMESDTFEMEAIDTLPLSGVFESAKTSYSINLSINTDNTN